MTVPIQRVNENTFRLVAYAPLVISEEQERTGRFPILVEATAKENPSKKAVYRVNVNLEDIQQSNAQRSTPMPVDQRKSKRKTRTYSCPAELCFS